MPKTKQGLCTSANSNPQCGLKLKKKKKKRSPEYKPHLGAVRDCVAGLRRGRDPQGEVSHARVGHRREGRGGHRGDAGGRESCQVRTEGSCWVLLLPFFLLLFASPAQQLYTAKLLILALTPFFAVWYVLANKLFQN